MPWLSLASILAACNLAAHTDDYSVGGARDDGGAPADGAPVADGNRAPSDAPTDLPDSPSDDTSAPSGDGPLACDPTIASGAISVPGGYESTIASGGYAYAFDDRAGSMSCISPSALCVAGRTAVVSAADWGAAFGFSLNQAMAPGAPSDPYTVASNAVGIAVLLSNFPVGTRVAIDHGGAEYCVALTGATATPKWAQFNTQCWNNQGLFLSGPPDDATFIHLIVPAIATARAFDFCAISIAFAFASPEADAGTDGGPKATPDSGGDAAADAASDGGRDAASDAASDGAGAAAD